MNLFFGKISKKYDTKQIEEGYYEAPKNSSWFGDIKIGDFCYIIGGDKIQFWKAREWVPPSYRKQIRLSQASPLVITRICGQLCIRPTGKDACGQCH